MTAVLDNGEQIPLVGYGTSGIPEGNIERCLFDALDVGYRHIDTAHFYRNEKFIGNALTKYLESGKLRREDVFITSKLPLYHMRPELVLSSLEESMASLQVDYLDLYLIHCPVGAEILKGEKVADMELKQFPVNLPMIWKEMEKLVAMRKVKSIGVSNFNSEQIKRICSTASILPVVNQVEAHIRLAQFELQRLCDTKQILLMAYAPLGSPGRRKQENGLSFMEEQIIKDLATKYKKSPAQIMLRWLTKRRIIIIPKSETKQRMQENMEIFDFQLDEMEMARIATLNEDQRLFTFSMVATHPEYPFGIPY